MIREWRCLTLRDPWAQLVARGHKTIETRGPTFATNWRGPLAIHSSAKLTREETELSFEVPFRSTLGLHGTGKTPTLWPRGCIVAICDLVDVVRIEVLRGGYGLGAGMPRPAGETTFVNDIVTAGSEPVGYPERSWGHWETGRKALVLANVRKVVPVPAKGMLGVWRWNGELKEIE